MTRILPFVALAGLALAGCGADAPAPAAPTPTKATRHPYGWKAYPHHRETSVKELGPAADAKVVDENGHPFELASAWANHRALVIFYRGSW